MISDMSPEARSLPQEEVIDRDAFIAEHGLEEIAGLQIEAHGGVYTVRDAVAECPPFAKMVTALEASLAELPISNEDKSKVIEKSIRSAAVSTETVAIPEAKKKF